MYDLSRCYIDFSILEPGEKMVDRFPELGAFPEFMECTDDMIKIAILSGDLDSPFSRTKERETMIRSIFEFLGIDHRTNQVMFDKIVKYRHQLVIGAWIRYLQIVHETEYTDLLLARKDYEFFIQQTNEIKMDKESDLNYYKRRSEARERVKELGQEIRRIEAKIFPDSKAAREAALMESRLKVHLYAEKHAEPYTYI